MEDGSETAYTNYGQGARLEYYPLGVSWEDALKNSEEAKQAGFNPRYTELFRNLFFDFSNQDSYIIKKLAVKVTDVEEDFQQYALYQKVLADKRNQPPIMMRMERFSQNLTTKRISQNLRKSKTC